MQNYRIIYLRQDYINKSTPVGCVAISFDRKNVQINYQLSVLNPSDEFNRSMARQLAIGRIIEKPISVKSVLCNSASSTHDVICDVMYDIENNPNLPNRSRNAAQAWLTQNNSIEISSNEIHNADISQYSNLSHN